MNKKVLEKLRNHELEILDFIKKVCDENNLTYFLTGGTLLGAIRHDGFIPWDDDIDIAMPRKDYQQFIEVFPENQKFVLDSYETNRNYWLPFIKVRNNESKYIEKDQLEYSGNTGIWVDIFPMDNSGILDKFKFKFTSITKCALSKKNNITYKKGNKIKNLIVIVMSILPKKTIQNMQYKIMTLSKKDDSYYLLNLGSQYGYNKQKHVRDNFFPVIEHMFENKKYFIPKNYKEILVKIYGSDYMKLPPIEKRITHNPIKIIFSDGEEVDFNEKI